MERSDMPRALGRHRGFALVSGLEDAAAPARIARAAEVILAEADIVAEPGRRVRIAAAVRDAPGIGGPEGPERLVGVLFETGALEPPDAMAVAFAVMSTENAEVLRREVLRVREALVSLDQGDPGCGFVQRAFQTIAPAVPDIVRGKCPDTRVRRLAWLSLLHVFRRDPGSRRDVLTAEAAARAAARRIPERLEAALKPT